MQATGTRDTVRENKVGLELFLSTRPHDGFDWNVSRDK